uniref:Alpha 1,4-glycosyltransferase domain-containing protein n=1 Tax=viral metagenome TaxID=1070528 RepID=A0A6C0CQS2_9ZZZZ
MSTRNIFLYWVGKEYKLISILRNLIYLHSTNGVGYKVHLITDKNIRKYINDLPIYFSNLLPAHQADFVRVNLICDHGGIWLDSDTLVIDSLDSLFDILEKNDGFFMKENNTTLCNGVFGSKKQTKLMKLWKANMRAKLDYFFKNRLRLDWTVIGSVLMKDLFNTHPNLFDNYTIFQGLDNIYPVNWPNCVEEFIQKPYNNYKNIVREYQPLVTLVNSVYKALEHKTEKDILEGNMPINYFINKSFENNRK